MSRPTVDHGHSEVMPKVVTEKSLQVYSGNGAMSSSETHLEREDALSSYSRQDKDNGSDGKEIPRKMRAVTFHSIMFFESGEIENLPEDSDEEAIRTSSSDITEETDLPDADNYQYFFRWEGKKSHESQSEIERPFAIADDDDTKADDDKLVYGDEQQSAVNLSGLNLLSNNSARGGQSPPSMVAHDVQPSAVTTAGLNLGKLFCGLADQPKRKSRGTMSPEITSMTHGTQDVSEFTRLSAFHGSKSYDFSTMGISSDLIKVKEDNQGPRRSSPQKFYHVVLH